MSRSDSDKTGGYGASASTRNEPSSSPQTEAAGGRHLNRLERAGWAAIAAETLALKWGDAVALREMVLSAGRFVSIQRLDECSGLYESRKRNRMEPARRVPTRMARIRGALEDLGVPRAAVENSRGLGYAIAPHYARLVRDIIERAA